MTSLEKKITLLEFSLDKIKISLSYNEKGYNNWREKKRNVCQSKTHENVYGITKPLDKHRSF